DAIEFDLVDALEHDAAVHDQPLGRDLVLRGHVLEPLAQDYDQGEGGRQQGPGAPIPRRGNHGDNPRNAEQHRRKTGRGAAQPAPGRGAEGILHVVHGHPLRIAGQAWTGAASSSTSSSLVLRSAKMRPIEWSVAACSSSVLAAFASGTKITR